MDKIKICLDPGSCHMGNFSYAVELLELAIEVKADYIKWQLGTSSPNIEFPLTWWDELQHINDGRIEMIASFFTDKAFMFLVEKKPKFIKFAYSRNNRIDLMKECLKRGITPIVSCDIMNRKSIPTDCLRLFCIPEYPVKYKIDFDCLFSTFDGFSDHTLGYNQTIGAILAGATFIEKHFTLDWYDINLSR
jgi:sialic acid synthase SpsE